jgi:high-affinity iron transporter
MQLKILALLFGLLSAPIEQSPRALVHLLEYLAADYGGAVQNGKVLSASEYAEQMEFIGMANEMGATLAKSPDYANVQKDLATLKRFVSHKEDAEKVSALALQIRNEVLNISKLEVAPSRWPSLKNGQTLFAERCASCHGVTGKGDGPEGRGLDPAPRNFLDNDHMKEISPFHAYNVVRLGIPGTGMKSFPDLKDKEIWDLSFYVLSLRYQNEKDNFSQTSFEGNTQDTLKEVATLSDDQLRAKLTGGEDEKNMAVAILRLKEGEKEKSNSLPIARKKLTEAADLYRAGKKDEARQTALMAYLEGIEPVEPQLKGISERLVTNLELAMAEVRAMIEKSKPLPELENSILKANSQIDTAEIALQNRESSPWISFSLASGIMFREGFEAVLMIIAILGVIRATNAKRAARFVHGGWITAIGLGILSWFFSGWLIGISGAQREMTEAVTSLIAVAVLLYMGFWLHSKTEIKKWTAFIDGRVKAVLDDSKSRWALFGLAFIAVFREAFETVLFMRAIWIEGGNASKSAMLFGIIISFVIIFALAWAFLKYSMKIPIRQLFAISSWVMVVLSVILVGKGFHSFQEAGTISVTPFSFLHLPFFGIYPTVETVVAQAGMVLICVVLWRFSKRSPSLDA